MLCSTGLSLPRRCMGPAQLSLLRQARSCAVRGPCVLEVLLGAGLSYAVLLGLVVLVPGVVRVLWLPVSSPGLVGGA